MPKARPKPSSSRKRVLPRKHEIAEAYSNRARQVIVLGDSLTTLRTCPDGFAKLIITSPPYNIGKVYESPAKLDLYLARIRPVIEQLWRVLAPDGSVCWQVGNYVKNREVYPLDILYYQLFKDQGFKLRNRVIWHFDHGLHSQWRFSGRYETLLWFTKTDDYTFNLDSVRVRSRYPGKRHFKGARKGAPSGNPLGKNPSDVWPILLKDWESSLWNIPNVKANHIEKTIHPCQFPIELVERCVLALTDESDWVLDPFSGVGSAILAALRHNRRAMGCEKEPLYVRIASKRIRDFYRGRLMYRPLGKAIAEPNPNQKVAQVPKEWLRGRMRSIYKRK